jgi:hypothetical protein
VEGSGVLEGESDLVGELECDLEGLIEIAGQCPE